MFAKANESEKEGNVTDLVLVHQGGVHTKSKILRSKAKRLEKRHGNPFVPIRLECVLRW